jgi:hypothetical protein
VGDVGVLITLWTVRAALACYFVTAAMRVRGRGLTAARAVWSVGAVLMWAHLAAAFHFVHHWSHAAAVAATARDTLAVTGLDWGGGVYFNYAMAAAWAGDAAWWWASRRGYERRPRWIDAVLHGYFLFMIFNAAVVFAAGAVRWCGLAAIVALAVYWRLQRRPRRATG